MAKRSIPTCVGTTWRSTPGTDFSPVHPHVRGDYGPEHGLQDGGGRSIPTCVGTTARVLGHGWAKGGPSPRAWGLPEEPQVGRPGQRSIPTCVGTTRVGRPPL